VYSALGDGRHMPLSEFGPRVECELATDRDDQL
jgi:hypothetical protein